MAKTKQLRSPCDDCAFLRTSEPDNLGGSCAEVYIGQTHGPFWIPCHSSKEYRCKESVMGDEAECVGSAIFRANIGAFDRFGEGLTTDDPENNPGKLFKPEPDTELVFATEAEFMAHHKQISIAEATLQLMILPPETIFQIELSRQGVHDPTKPPPEAA